VKILIVVATKFEIAPFTDVLGIPQTLTKHLSRYQTNHSQFDVLITGIGMVFTTYHVSVVLAKEKYDYALNVGVAGAIDKTIELGEIVNVVQDYFYELGAEDAEKWLDINDLGLLTSNDLPYTANGIDNDNLPKLAAIEHLNQVKGQTVNKVHGNLESIRMMQSRSKAQVESMEGAAFLYCCMQHQLPCAQIRAISNYVEVRNKNNWKMQLAIQQLNDFLKSNYHKF
jgi:futalosine hydrolase